jgi:hypothetical protein
VGSTCEGECSNAADDVAQNFGTEVAASYLHLPVAVSPQHPHQRLGAQCWSNLGNTRRAAFAVAQEAISNRLATSSATRRALVPATRFRKRASASTCAFCRPWRRKVDDFVYARGRLMLRAVLYPTAPHPAESGSEQFSFDCRKPQSQCLDHNEQITIMSRELSTARSLRWRAPAIRFSRRGFRKKDSPPSPRWLEAPRSHCRPESGASLPQVHTAKTC